MDEEKRMNRRTFLSKMLYPLGGIGAILALFYYKQIKQVVQSIADPKYRLLSTQPIFKNETNEHKKIQENIYKSLEVVTEHLIVMSADWCGPCHELERDLENNYNLKPYKLNLLESNKFDGLEKRTYIIWDLSRSDVQNTVFDIFAKIHHEKLDALPILVGQKDELLVFYIGYDSAILKENMNSINSYPKNQ